MRRDFAEGFCVIAEDIPCGVGEATIQKPAVKDRAGMAINVFYRVLGVNSGGFCKTPKTVGF